MNTYLMFVIFINSNIDKQIKTCAYEIISVSRVRLGKYIVKYVNKRTHYTCTCNRKKTIDNRLFLFRTTIEKVYRIKKNSREWFLFKDRIHYNFKVIKCELRCVENSERNN